MWQPARALALVGATVALVAASQGAAATPQQTTSVYVVGSLTVPGVDTGLVLRKGHPVTVSATGTVCPGTGFCTTPDGTWVVDTTESPYDGYVLPGAPAYGLVARVGTGPWVQVGTGPVQIKGKGDLVFAFNDDKFPDNTGSFTVTVTSAGGGATQASGPGPRSRPPRPALACRPAPCPAPPGAPGEGWPRDRRRGSGRPARARPR